MTAKTKRKGESAQVPTRPSELTVDWVNSVLAEHRIEPMTDLRIEPVGAGLYGTIVRIVESNGGTEAVPRSFVAKFSAEDLEIREALMPLQIYSREYNFFTKLSADLPIRTPTCYFAHYDPDTADSVLLMDYVEGEVFDDLRGATHEQAERAFDVAARLHVSMLGSEILEADWIHPLGGPPVIDGVVAATAQALPEGIELIRDRCPSWMKQNANRAPEIIRTQLAELNLLPHTLVHLDYRLSNMIFHGEDAEAGMTLVDWHSVLRAPGVCDIAFFTLMAINVSDRREWEDELVNRYLEKTHGWTERVWPDWFKMAWHRMSLFSAFNCIRNATVLDMSEAATRELLYAWIERSCAMAEDHNAVSYLSK